MEGCSQPGAFTTRTRPTWCLDHLRQLYAQGGLTLLEEFTKPSAYLLTRCTRCRYEGHYRFEYVLDCLQASEFVCRACYWRAWAKGARAMSSCSAQPHYYKGSKNPTFHCSSPLLVVFHLMSVPTPTTTAAPKVINRYSPNDATGHNPVTLPITAKIPVTIAAIINTIIDSFRNFTIITIYFGSKLLIFQVQ
ncbi:hypothetical protein CCASP_04225 [Corynebacterium caspium DSM 44850]|nr:hypothetical protein CCASP_04225 [Corynebacterium caspium DSM 44850]